MIETRFTLKTVALLLWLFTSTAVVHAQTQAPQSPLKAADVLAGAKKLYLEEGPAKALPEYEKALALFRQEGDRKGEAITIGLMGNAYKKLGQHAKAIEHLQQSLTMKQELGDRLEEGKTLSHIGLFYWETSEYPKAIEFFGQASVIATELGDRNLAAAIHNNMGLVYDEIGDARAVEEYNKALELYRGSEPTKNMADTVGNLGGWHMLHGEYAEALRYYEQALEIDEKLGVKPSIAIDLENIGLALNGLGRYQDALKILDRAITLAHDAGSLKDEADSRKAKASALLQLGRYNEALDQYNQAIKVYRGVDANSEPEFKQQLVEALNNVGNLEVRLGDLASAERDFRRAIEVSEQIKHPRGVTVNLISLGDLQLRQKRFPEAQALYSQALTRATEANDKGNAATSRVQLAHTYRSLKKFEDAEQQARQASEVARETQAKPLQADALYALAEVYRARERAQDALNVFSEGSALVRDLANPELSWRFDFGRGQTLQTLNRNDEALSAFQNAVKTIETVRNELREERFRAGYIEDKYQVYVALVQLLLKLGRAEEAFVAAEKLRARSYLDMLQRGQPPIRNQSQRERDEAFRNRIHELQKKLEGESTKPKLEQRRATVDVYSKELQEAETEYENFLDDISTSEPSYAAVRNLKVPSGEQVRQQLPAGTALIAYVLAEHELVVFVITAEGLHATTVAAENADVRSRVETLRDLMLRNKTNEWKLPAAALYRMLITPVETEGWLKGVRQLYIVPHAILHYVPFAVLSSTNRASTVLVDDYVVAYLPAAAALVHSETAVKASGIMLAMAPASTRLRYTQLESESVSRFFPKKHTLLLGSRATESSFKRLAEGFEFIHLSTHGYFNKLNPLLSGLTLEPDATNDGRLDVHEIMELKLKASLVTLSACDTALGSGYFTEVPVGDDLVGLTRAFLSAGAPSVLASLWQINDRSTVELMQSFYRRQMHTDKASALAQAQRAMRVSRSHSHPYYWGAFVLVGQMN